MKISELINKLQQLQDSEGDVEFEFDWDIGSSSINEEDVKLTYSSFSDIYFLSFH